MVENVQPDRCRRIVDAVAGSVVADRRVLETVLTGIVGGGHVLLEDVPGTGKTLAARSFAAALGLRFGRIQFTPDLLPTDVSGAHVFDEERREFEFREGPIFANVVLADEINRASPKTQAGLLEAMEEEQVTVDGETYDLPDPFVVIATQNPVDQDGTYPLPAAQTDRFLVKTSLGYPDEEGELAILERRTGGQNRADAVDQVCDREGLLGLRERVEEVFVHRDVREYIVALTRATRSDGRVEAGVSPRGTERLFEAARARALIDGREFVTPATVKDAAGPVLAHRLVLTTEADLGEETRHDVVADVLEATPVPEVTGRA
jgi:MoxR-like ATPase